MKVKLHSQCHEWRDRDEEGQTVIYRAEWDSRKWSFKFTGKKDPEWYDVEKPTLEQYEALRDVMWRKYQRKRLNFKFIEDIDKILQNLRTQG